MVWVRHSDNFTEEMDAQGLSTDAVTLYVAGLCYCNRLENDGQIPRRKAPRLYTMDDPEAAIKELVASGHWAETASGYQVVGQYDGDDAPQPSSAKLAAKRAATAARVRNWRSQRAQERVSASNDQAAGNARNGVTNGVSNATGNAAPRPGPGPARRVKGQGQGPASPPAPTGDPASGTPASASGDANESILSVNLPSTPAPLAGYRYVPRAERQES